MKHYIYCDTLLFEIAVFCPKFFNSNVQCEANLIRLEAFGFYETKNSFCFFVKISIIN